MGGEGVRVLWVVVEEEEGTRDISVWGEKRCVLFLFKQKTAYEISL